MATAAFDLTGGVPEEREFVVAEKPDDGLRDAVNVWIEEENGLFAMRIGVEAVGNAWDRHEFWLDVAFADGRLLSKRGDGAVHAPYGADGRPTVRGTGPVRFECEDPFRRWTVSYRGQAAETSAQAIIDDPDFKETRWSDLEIAAEMDMAAPPWVPGSLLPEAAAALGGEQGSFMSPRYEQLFRCSGTLTVDGVVRPFKGNGLRIRRTGFRAFAGFWGHCWQSAVFPDGRAFGFNIYPPREDGEPNYAEGWIIDTDGVRTPARPVEVPWLRRFVTGGEDVSCVLETVNGRRVAIAGTTFVNVRSRGGFAKPVDWPADFPLVQQSHAFYTWDGQSTTGMIERSSKPSVMES
ncbi:hypothetical protein EDF57_105124 [Novosphingobium sp. PhB55]|uniref:hypothetical protein n=1 Tax=Novosphingobium sp. PhB55 TaxID=2485106 RepID=UPI00106707C5|nr:hypothetical protein [Novosphingobium sp. PhB55]TDW63652.1 hypothetical protein EDF57_105124 [Novosphingobium sp. PhB55]